MGRDASSSSARACWRPSRACARGAQSQGRRQEHRAPAGRRRVGGEADSRRAAAGRLARRSRAAAVQRRRHDADDSEVSDAILTREELVRDRNDAPTELVAHARRRFEPRTTCSSAAGPGRARPRCSTRSRLLPVGRSHRPDRRHGGTAARAPESGAVRGAARAHRLPAVTVRDLLQGDPAASTRSDRGRRGARRRGLRPAAGVEHRPRGQSVDDSRELRRARPGTVRVLRAPERRSSCRTTPFASRSASAVDYVLHLERENGVRRVFELLRINAYDPSRDRYDVSAEHSRSEWLLRIGCSLCLAHRDVTMLRAGLAFRAEVRRYESDRRRRKSGRSNYRFYNCLHNVRT